MKLPKMTAEPIMNLSGSYHQGVVKYLSGHLETNKAIIPMFCNGCHQIRETDFNFSQHILCKDENGDACVPIVINGREEVCMTRGDIARAREEAQTNELMRVLVEKSQVAASKICVTDKILAVPVDIPIKHPVPVYS